MKIAVIGVRAFPGMIGGIETHCQQLYPRLVAQGHQVTAFVRDIYMAEGQSEYQGVRFQRISVQASKNWETLVYTLRALAQAFREDYDIIHLHALGPSFFAPWVRLNGRTVVCTHHGQDYLRAKWGLAGRVFLRLGEFFMRAANRVISVSPSIAANLGWPQLRVVPNGIVLPTQRPTPTLPESLGAKPGRYFFFAGRFVPEKELPCLIQAFASLRSDWKLVIAGDGPQENEHVQEIRRLAAATPGVILAGFRTGEELEALYCHAGCFVLPSSVEGFCIALLEALSWQLPVIASDIPQLQDAANPAIRYFPVRDTAALGHLLQEAANGNFPVPPGAIELFLGSRYDWDHLARQTQIVYQEALGV